MRWGDINSKFFHASTFQRKERNHIQRLKGSTGDWVEGLDNLFNVISAHFQDLYTSDRNPIEPECLNQIPRVVSDQMN